MHEFTKPLAMKSMLGPTAIEDGPLFNPGLDW